MCAIIQSKYHWSAVADALWSRPQAYFRATSLSLLQKRTSNGG